MSIEYNEAVNDFNDRLKEINLLEINAINFCEKITELDAKLKASAHIRNAITNEFYNVFRRKLQASIEVALDMNTQILTKCLKNSAAAFKEDLDGDEKEICQLLIDCLNEAICSNETSLDLNVKAENGQNEGDEIDELASAQNTKHTIYQNVFQYFFNLIQGKLSFATNYEIPCFCLRIISKFKEYLPNIMYFVKKIPISHIHYFIPRRSHSF
jgi:hypothetical protein